MTDVIDVTSAVMILKSFQLVSSGLSSVRISISTQKRRGVGEFEVEGTEVGRRVELGGEDGTADLDGRIDGTAD